MTSDVALERTIGKILDQTEASITSKLQETLENSTKTLDDAVAVLDDEYDRIIADGKKEAEKIEKQIVGSADLEARNKQLVLVEKSVDRAFAKAIDQITNTERNDSYSALIAALLDESVKILGTSDIIVLCNDKDRSLVQSNLSQFSGAELSSETIDCMGGVQVKSRDGSTTFDNTLDARLDRLKPLIRKEIAFKFGLGN